MLVFSDGQSTSSLGSSVLDQLVVADALKLMPRRQGRVFAYATEHGSAEVFVEVYPPPPHLIIFGGVHVAIPLVSFAKTLGFRVTMVDARAKFANRQRFPRADDIIVAWPDEAVSRLKLDTSTFVAILTHDPKIDEPALKSVLGTPVAYVGAIGSRKTHAERFERMARQGVGAALLRQVYAPIGLDLGAESPEEIALSIMAEIVAVQHGASAGFLRDSSRG